ncbi:hypothetical protein GNF18_07215 [Ligilactobacillus pobuzihii]|uniref:hypothetical protein n=1 Tax=Ligilactobacillus pobuzihii TaxID=449659 RepID=UPI0019D06BBC|nr:hypothetical protein [Ligilactobacillus pobuzihii]MBN7274924.1 hypothetical protein [Ligilactobacillus pobuzihii]
MKTSKYENYRKILDKKTIKETASVVGVASSLKVWDRIIGSLLIIFFGAPILYLAGVSLAGNFASFSEDVNVISFSTAQAVYMVARNISPFNKFLIALLIVVTITNVFPKGNLPRQTFFGLFNMDFLLICFCVSIVPLLFGLTLGAYGWLGLIFQSLFAVYMIGINLVKITSMIKYGDKFKGFNAHILATVIITLLAIMSNHFVFRIGYSNFVPNKIELITGLGVLIWSVICVIFISMMTKYTVYASYFLKYANQFYRDLDFTDKEWYGKRKAKKIQRTKEKEKNK